MALTIHEDGLHSCGHPRSLAFEDFNEGMFEMREAKCQACAAIDLYRRSQESRPHEPGHTAGVVNLLAPGDEFRRWRGSAANKPNGDQGNAEQPEQHGDAGQVTATGDPTEGD